MIDDSDDDDDEDDDDDDDDHDDGDDGDDADVDFYYNKAYTFSNFNAIFELVHYFHGIPNFFCPRSHLEMGQKGYPGPLQFIFMFFLIG